MKVTNTPEWHEKFNSLYAAYGVKPVSSDKYIGRKCLHLRLASSLMDEEYRGIADLFSSSSLPGMMKTTMGRELVSLFYNGDTGFKPSALQVLQIADHLRALEVALPFHGVPVATLVYWDWIKIIR